MKKFLFAFAIIATILSSSCSDDDNYNPHPLSGTTWISTILESNTDEVSILKLDDETFSMSVITKVDGEDVRTSIAGKYIYEHPAIVLIPNNTVDHVVRVGVINGNRIILDKEDKYPFVKQ